MADDRPKIALITGAGFSKALGGLMTTDLERKLLETPAGAQTPEVEGEVTTQLTKFWESAFGFSRGGPAPQLADHFTTIDLAANSGHNLGTHYTPSRLRAIRRLTLHRIFTIIAAQTERGSGCVESSLAKLREAAKVGVISLNWDCIAERAVGEYYYKPRTVFWAGQGGQGQAVPVMKLHGSVNWAYCDTCRVIKPGPAYGRGAVGNGILLDADDFRCLGAKKAVVDAVAKAEQDRAAAADFDCKCGSRLSTRVGTFSYRKDYALGPYQAIWYSALRWLATSKSWLFVGYSMPAADFEFRHLLKTAQMAQRDGAGQPKITVVLNEDSDAELRCRRFFGCNLLCSSQLGLTRWVDLEMQQWLAGLG